MTNDFDGRDLSKISMCVMRLCGIISYPAPPKCERDDCPGRKWWEKKEKEEN